MSSCSKSASDTNLKNKSLIDRIRSDTELSIKTTGAVEHFLEKNPEYNPNWVAKVNVSEQEALIIENELSKKQPQLFKKRGALSDATAWWTPSKVGIKFQYFTSHNAPVVVVLSHRDNGCDLFINWSSP